MIAGHSHWAGIQIQKGRADKERSKNFSKLSSTVAAKLGDKDPDINPRLRAAIKQQSKLTPKIYLEQLVSRTSDNKNYENLRYEGFGPFSSALIETLTDNKNNQLRV